MNWIAYLLSIAAGALNPVQSGANAELKKTLDNTVWTTLAVYLSALAAVAMIQLFVRAPLPGADAMRRVPWWAWVGGVISIGSTVPGLSYAQKMGSGVFTGLSVTASLAASIALDHFGLIGFKQHPVSWMRILGSGLMIAGLWLIAKF